MYVLIQVQAIVHNQLCPVEQKHFKLHGFWSLTPQKPHNLHCFEHVKHEYPDYFVLILSSQRGPGGGPGELKEAQEVQGFRGAQGAP